MFKLKIDPNLVVGACFLLQVSILNDCTMIAIFVIFGNDCLIKDGLKRSLPNKLEFWVFMMSSSEIWKMNVSYW